MLLARYICDKIYILRAKLSCNECNTLSYDCRFQSKRMAFGNNSIVTEFILIGLTDQPNLQLPLFFLFLVMYIVTMTGNLGLVILIGLNSHLHTPMYFFLFNLSLIDLCYSSVFTPKMLLNFIINKNIISYIG